MALTGFQLPVANKDQVSLYKEQYVQNFLKKAGNNETSLMSTVDIIEADPGSLYLLVDAVLPQTDSNDMDAVSARDASTSYVNTEFVKRKILTNEYRRAELLMSSELKSKLASPKAPIMDVTMDKFNVAINKAIVDAALGTAYEIYYDTNGATQETSETLPAGNKVLDSSRAGFTFARFLKIEETLRNLGTNVDQELIFVVVGPRQLAEIKAQSQFTSHDYTGTFTLANGSKLPIINNCVVITSNQLSTYNDGSYVYRKCVAYTKRGMALALGAWEIDLIQSSEKWANYSLIHKRRWGASRMDLGRVIQFDCYENDYSS